jgi:hypothetical protein
VDIDQRPTVQITAGGAGKPELGGDGGHTGKELDDGHDV